MEPVLSKVLRWIPRGRLPAAPLRLVVSLACCLASQRAAAQLPATRLVSLFPPVLQCGVTNELTAGGESIEGPFELVFSEPSIRATPKPGGAAVFLVTAPIELAGRSVEARLAGRFGVSNPRLIGLSGAPVLGSAPGDSSWETAQKLPAETWAYGRVEPNSARWFRTAAPAGADLSVEVDAQGLDSRLGPVVGVFAPDHTELGHGRLAAVDFIAPASGEVWISLHDETYQGGEAYPFRLRITGAPRVESVVPAALRRGATNQVRVFGRRLPGGRPGRLKTANGAVLEEAVISIVAPPAGGPAGRLALATPPAGFLLDLFGWSCSNAVGISSPHPFVLVDEPVRDVEQGLADVPPPVAVGGLFPHEGETNAFDFLAKKGEPLWMELIADRLGWRTDPWLLVQRLETNSQGAVTAHEVLQLSRRNRTINERDFSDGGRDLAGRFEPEHDGRYRVLVRDFFNLAADRPRRPFVVRLGPVRPEFHLVATAAAPPKTRDDDHQVRVLSPVLRRGETSAIRVYAVRSGGFDGPIELGVSNLPPGVVAAPCRFAGGQSSRVLLLTAALDAPDGRRQLRLLGSASPGASEALSVTTVWPVANYDEERTPLRLAGDLTISVMSQELSPVTLAARGPFEAPAGGKVKLELSVTRRADWGGNPKLKLAGEPACDKAPEVELDPKATNLVYEVNLADLKLAEGRHSLWLQAPVVVKYRDRPEAVVAAEEDLKKAAAAEGAAVGDAKKPAADQRKAAEERKKSAEERARPADVSWMLYSEPFILDVKSAAPGAEKK